MAPTPSPPLHERRVRDMTWGDVEELVLSVGTYLLLLALALVVGRFWLTAAVQVATEGWSASPWRLRAFLVGTPLLVLTWLAWRRRRTARAR